MKKTNKKGFTIVELVIVIAVIAILSAVLIPTFSGIVKTARLNADKQTVRQLNTALATNVDADTYQKMADTLIKQGYKGNETLTPASKGYDYYWVSQYNTIVLVKDGKVEYPVDSKFDNFATLGATKLDASNYVATVANTAAFLDAMAIGNDISLSGDVAIADTFTVNGDVAVYLNGHDLDVSANGARPFVMDQGAKLVIDAKDSEIKTARYGLVNVLPGVSADITINGGSFVGATDNGAFIKVRPTTDTSVVVNVNLNNVTYVDNGYNGATSNSYVINTQGFDGKLNLNVNGGSYTSALGFNLSSGSFSNVEINTVAHAVEIFSGEVVFNNVVINGCNKSEKQVNPQGALDFAFAIMVAYNGTAKLNGVEFNTNAKLLSFPNTNGSAVIDSNCKLNGNAITSITDIYRIDGATVANITFDGVTTNVAA